MEFYCLNLCKDSKGDPFLSTQQNITSPSPLQLSLNSVSLKAFHLPEPREAEIKTTTNKQKERKKKRNIFSSTSGPQLFLCLPLFLESRDSNPFAGFPHLSHGSDECKWGRRVKVGWELQDC